MVASVDGVCIATDKGAILYWTSLLGGVQLSGIQRRVAAALADGDPVTDCGQPGDHALHIKRSGCCWLLTTPCQSPSVGERLSLVQALHWLHSAVLSTIVRLTAATEDDITADDTAAAVAQNSITIHQLILSIMGCGVVQMQPLPRILSQLTLHQRKQPTFATNSLFGVVRVAGITQLTGGPHDDASQLQQRVCLDVVERVRGSGLVSSTGSVTAVTGEVRGSVILKCPQSLLNRAVCVAFNSDISEHPTVAGGLRAVCCATGVSLFGRTVRCPALLQPSCCLLQYTLPPALPCTLLLHCEPLQHSSSDCEIVVTLRGTLGCQVVAPHITVCLSLPASTVTVTTRHTGHSQQSTHFAAPHQQDQPTLTWTLNNFPGDAQAKAFIRVVGCGRNCTVSRATLDFEVSQWLCSKLRVERLTVTPALPSQPWVRYLTLGERISLNFSSV